MEDCNVYVRFSNTPLGSSKTHEYPFIIAVYRVLTDIKKLRKNKIISVH